MKKLMYTNMVENLLGRDLYIKLLTDIAKEYKSNDIVHFGSNVVEKCCTIIMMIGMSNRIKMDNIKIYIADQAIDISCKEFAKRYENYTKVLENNLI